MCKDIKEGPDVFGDVEQDNSAQLFNRYKNRKIRNLLKGHY